MSSLEKARGTLWAWGALAALLLGGCVLDATGAGDPEESYGVETEELAAADEGDRAPSPRQDALPPEDAPPPEEESGNDLGPVVVLFTSDGTPNDPHPDPWRALDAARDTASPTGSGDH